MIYLHGNSSSRLESLTIVEYLIPMNISVCGIDLSGISSIVLGSGHSEGEFISLGYYESQDVQALYEYLKEHKVVILFIYRLALHYKDWVMGEIYGICNCYPKRKFQLEL